MLNDLHLSQIDNPQLIEEIYASAYHHYENGKYEKAVSLFRFLIINDVKSKRFWMGIGAAQQMLKKYDEAIQSYTFAALINDKDPYLFYHAAECLFSRGDIPLALQTLDSVKVTAGTQSCYQGLLAQVETLKQVWKSPLKESKRS